MSDFTNKIISGINSGLKTVGTGSKAAIKKTKLKSSIKKLENEIMDISSEIGVKLYNWCVLNPEGDIPRGDYIKYLEEICSRNDLIKKYRAKIEEIDNEKGLPETTKSDKTSHGYGLTNIRKVAQKYYGDIDIRQDEKSFTLTVMLIVN